MISMGPRTARAWELRQQGKTLQEIADMMGVKRSGATSLIHYAKQALGLVEIKKRNLAGSDEDDGEFDTTPGCARCGLRGSHECLPASAVAYLGRDGDQSFVRNRAA